MEQARWGLHRENALTEKKKDNLFKKKKKKVSEKNLIRKNKMLSILFIILSENYSTSEGAFLKELIR